MANQVIKDATGTSFEVIEQKLPSPWAYYLTYGLDDSFENGEEKEIAETLEHLKLSNAMCVDVLDDANFCTPPIYLNWLLAAGDYSTFIFHRYE